MRVRTIVMGLLATLAATMASPAFAGGWWTYPQLEDKTPGLAIGDTTSVTAEVMFSTEDEAVAARAEGSYHAYLVRGIDRALPPEAMTQADPGNWWTTPEETIHLAELTFGANDVNLMSVAATFVVPDVAPGAYDLMLCNFGCSEPLADVVPLGPVYVGDRATIELLRQSGSAAQQVVAETIGELERLEARLDHVATTAGRGVDEIRTHVDELAATIDEIETSLASAELGTDARSAGTTWVVSWAGWLIAVAVGAWAWSKRRDTGHIDSDELDPVAVVEIINDEQTLNSEFVTRSWRKAGQLPAR